MDNLIEQFNQEIADFYGVEPISLQVKILYSREEIDAVKGYKTKNWVIGFTKGDVVYLLAKDKWETESCHPKEQFEGALKHEIAHLYYYLYKHNSAPSWLNEGMAVLLANQDFLCHYSGEITIDLLDKFHEGNKNSGPHEIGGTLVKKIFEQFGKEKLLEIVKIGDREERYEELKKMFPWLK